MSPPVMIIAGGRSRRMGTSKALLERPDGSRQIDFLARLAADISDTVCLSLADDSEISPDLPVITDRVTDAGPLGALASYAAARPGQPVLAVACDLMLLDVATLACLIERRDSSRGATCFASRIDGKPEPLCTIYEADSLGKAADFINGGTFCARRFLASLDPLVLELPSPAALDNVNSPADLREALAKLEAGVTTKRVSVLYFAKLREERGMDAEIVETLACTAGGLYEELRFRHRLTLEPGSLRAARNEEFCDWSDPIQDNDEIIFIPPVSGG